MCKRRNGRANRSTALCPSFSFGWALDWTQTPEFYPRRQDGPTGNWRSRWLQERPLNWQDNGSSDNSTRLQAKSSGKTGHNNRLGTTYPFEWLAPLSYPDPWLGGVGAGRR